MPLALIIIGLVLLVGSIGTSIWRTVIMCNKLLSKKKKKLNKETTTEETETEVNTVSKRNQLKDLLILVGTCAASSIGGVLLVVGSLLSTNLEIQALHFAEAIIGAFLFFPILTWFFYTLTLKHFKTDMEEKVFKIVKFSNVIAVFASIVFGLIMMEGAAYYITYPLPNKIQFGSDGILGYPNATESGGFSIAFYAICILSGAVLVYFICDHKFYKIYGKHGMLESVFLTAFPAGIIGARLWFCYVLEWDKYSTWTGEWNAPNNPFAIWDGGLAIMGGALLGIIVGVLWVIFVKKEIRIREAVDIIVPTILIAQAVGRWGNFFNLEVYGAAMITMQEGFWIPSFVKFEMVSVTSPGFIPINDLKDITQFYVPLFYVEFITNLAGYYFIRYLFGERKLFIGIAKLVNKAKHNDLSEKAYNTISTAFPKGGCAGLYLMWYGFTRLFLEPLRYSDYEYQASSDSAIMLIFLGLGVIAIFAIYQYVIEPRYPFYKSRRKKYEALEMAEANEIAVETTVDTEEKEAEVIKNVAKPKDSSKKHKDTGSLNDDF